MTLLSGNPVRQYDCQTYDATTKEAESYVAPWNSQVVSITSKIPAFTTVLQLTLGRDMSNSLIFCLSHYLYRFDSMQYHIMHISS